MPRLPQKRMFAWKDLVLDTDPQLQRVVDCRTSVKLSTLARIGKMLSRSPDSTNKRSRRDEAREVVHLGPVQDSRNVVVDAVSETSRCCRGMCSGSRSRARRECADRAPSRYGDRSASRDTMQTIGPHPLRAVAIIVVLITSHTRSPDHRVTDEQRAHPHRIAGLP